MLEEGTLKNKKVLIDKYVKCVTIYKDKIIIELSIADVFTLKKKCWTYITVQKKNRDFSVLFCYTIVRINGGEGVYLPKGNFIFNIEDIKELLLFRSMEIEDLLLENSIYI